jgi:iron complex transport system ATP-binding protein
MIELESVSYAYQNKPIIKQLSCHIPDNKITAIIGPNGAGKSTFLKLLGKLITANSGRVIFKGKDINKIKHKCFAQELSFLMQNPVLPDSYTVEQLVMLGRYPYLGLFGKSCKKDREAVNNAIAQVGLSEIKTMQLDQLSGGQQQRAWIAMAIAQDTPYILLDEPTSFLDLSYQLELLKLLRELRNKRKKTIIMVIHDVNLASYFSDEVLVLKDGDLIAQGNTREVLNESLMKDVFNVNMKDFSGTFIPEIL